MAPKFPIYKQLQGVNYRIDLASSEAEKKQAFALRYEVFVLELSQGWAASVYAGLDQDKYDHTVTIYWFGMLIKIF